VRKCNENLRINPSKLLNCSLLRNLIASFLAIRAVRKLAEDNTELYPRAAQIALQDFYVDDLELIYYKKLHQSKKKLPQEGKFELRKWASNALCLQDQFSLFDSLVEQKEFILSSDKDSEKRT